MNTNEKFFGLDTKWLYEKAQRDFEKLKENQTPDNIFNFFVTAYHLKDYIKEQHKKNETNDIRKKYANLGDLLKKAGFIANRGKHYKLKYKEYKNFTNEKKVIKYGDSGNHYGDKNLYYGGLYIITDDKGKEHIVNELAEQLLNEWKNFMGKEKIL